MYLTQSLRKALRECPRAVALVCKDRRLDFAALGERVARLAGALQRIGMSRGDRVAMLALNSAAYVEFLNGTWWAGGVVNPVNCRWTPREVAYSLDDCDTRILFVDESFASVVQPLRDLSRSLRTVVYCGEGPAPDGMLSYEQLLAEAEPAPDALCEGEELAAVMYTGGTTGMPKGVMLTHANLYLAMLNSQIIVPRESGGIGLVVAPFFHIAGCGLSSQLLGRLSTQVVLPAFDEVAVLSAIQNEKVTEMFLVPTMIMRLIGHPRFMEFDLSSLRILMYGAAPIDAALLERAMRAFPGVDFCQVYGMTELAPVVAVLDSADHQPGPDRARHLRAAGKPVPIAELRIVDANDRELEPGQVGEICARGPMVMKGYWNKPEQTASALRGGWMHTGDGGYMDEDGYLYVVDRLKDMIVSGGENVYSAEVENAIASLPQVSMCAVIGVPDDVWGERVHAVVMLHPGQVLTADELVVHCKTQIAGYKCPRSVEFLAELPLSPAGKLQKYVLRERHWAGRERQVN